MVRCSACCLSFSARTRASIPKPGVPLRESHLGVHHRALKWRVSLWRPFNATPRRARFASERPTPRAPPQLDPEAAGAWVAGFPLLPFLRVVSMETAPTLAASKKGNEGNPVFSLAPPQKKKKKTHPYQSARAPRNIKHERTHGQINEYMSARCGTYVVCRRWLALHTWRTRVI